MSYADQLVFSERSLSCANVEFHFRFASDEAVGLELVEESARRNFGAFAQRVEYLLRIAKRRVHTIFDYDPNIACARLA